MIPSFKSEQDVWHFFRGPDGAEALQDLENQFQKRFPKGHKESLRPLTRFLLDPDIQKRFGENNGFKFMKSFHPRALLLLLIYGQDYTPMKWESCPNLPVEPEWGGCFINSFHFMCGVNAHRKIKKGVEEEIVYVEGLADTGYPAPMLHAWNAKGLWGEDAIDWTWYTNSHLHRYFGIPFTDAELREIWSFADPTGKTFSSVFHKKHFERIEWYLHEFLARREEERAEIKRANAWATC